MLKSLAVGVVATSMLVLSGVAHAATISVVDLGQTDPSQPAPLFGQDVIVTDVNNAPIVIGGGVNEGLILGSNGSNSFNNAANYTDGTVGWDPFGVDDSSNSWLSIGGSSGSPVAGNGDSYATLSFTGLRNSLSFVWGSPSGINTVSLYDANGDLLGSVVSDGNSDLVAYDQNGNVTDSITSDPLLGNTSDPGAIVDITSNVAFSSAVLSDTSGGFEIGGVSAVPLPGALPMFAGALAGLAMLGARSRKRVAL
jgi:hypothetical protein